MFPRCLLLAAVLAADPLQAQVPAASVSASSPDGQLEVTVTAGEGLAYQVAWRGKPVIARSRLGLDPLNQAPLGPGLQTIDAVTETEEIAWRPLHGKTSDVRVPVKKLLIKSHESAGLQRELHVDFRIFNDGVAFRYLVPAQPALRELQLERELSEFRVAREGTAWPLILANYRTSYEDNYVELPLSGIKQDALIALPLLTEVPGSAWVAITEAHLENWAGLYLARNGLTLEAKLAPRADRPDVSVVRQTPADSPWRVIQIAAEPAKLIESNIVLALNPPSKIADTSWIQPGKTSWTWWSGDMAKNVSFTPGMNTKTLKHYIDFSAEAGMKYALIDEGWSTNNARGQGDLRQIKKEIDLPGLLEHAKNKGVKVWLWAHWEAVDRHMEEVFANFEKWGVAGVKIDFMDRDDQWMVGFYHRAAESAARHKLLLDFHGAYKPTGMSRTWPNVLTYEAVMGMEYLKWSARVTAEHDTVIPFTRMLAGPLDFTPGGMRNVRPSEFAPRNSEPVVPTTRAHQMALYVLFESGLQMLADYPGAYRGEKELTFLKAVPAAWDETRGIGGRPGQSAVVARRTGSEWYLGAITDGSSREIEIPLEFLPPGEFSAEIWADGDGPAGTVLSTKGVTRTSKLVARLAPAGGYAVHIRAAH